MFYPHGSQAPDESAGLRSPDPSRQMNIFMYELMVCWCILSGGGILHGWSGLDSFTEFGISICTIFEYGLRGMSWFDFVL
jgi:hypothetical protein